MCCNSNRSCGCGALASAINNLFGPPRCPQSCGCGNSSGGCGCGGSNGGNTRSGNGGCGCGNSSGGCGCGSTANLSAYTACGDQPFDLYYAQQYALLPSCSCGCNLGSSNINVYDSSAFGYGYYI